MFRCALNTPEVYPSMSRDFQLFCNVFDASHGWSKAHIDSLVSATSTEECSVSLIPLLSSKVGLFTEVSIDDDDLRCILGAFPHIIRNKGTWTAMQWTINLLHRYFNKGESPPALNINDKDCVIEVMSGGHLSYESLLLQLLGVVAPAGMTITTKVNSKSDKIDAFVVRENINITSRDAESDSMLYNHTDVDDTNSEIEHSIIEKREG